MGLAERRRIAEIKDQLPVMQEQLKGIVGYELPFTFDTTTFPEDAKVLDGYDYYKDYGMPMALRIFKDIAKDELGKSAVKEKTLSLENGLLLVKYGFYSYSDMVWGEDELKLKIENLL
jgi:hypothetical protein